MQRKEPPGHLASVGGLTLNDLPSYHIWLRASGYRPDTITRALRVATMYLSFAQGKDADDRATVIAWLAQAGERVKRVTMLNYHKDLRLLFRWAVGDGLVAKNPLDQIPKPKPSLYEREMDTRHLPYTEAELAILVEATPHWNWVGLRDRAILAVLYDTPLRASELCDLGLDDLDWGAQEVRVNDGKGGIRYEAVLSDRALLAIDRYLRHRPHDGPMLFIDRHGGPLSRHALGQMLKRLARRCSFPKPLSPHLFRHNWRVRMLQAGLSDAHVSAGMGHKTVVISHSYARQAVRQDAKARIKERLG